MIDSDFENKYLGRSLDLFLQNIHPQIQKIAGVIKVVNVLNSLLLFLFIILLIGGFIISLDEQFYFLNEFKNYIIFFIIFGFLFFIVIFLISSFLSKKVDKNIQPLILNYIGDIQYLTNFSDIKDQIEDMNLCKDDYDDFDIEEGYSVNLGSQYEIYNVEFTKTEKLRKNRNTLSIFEDDSKKRTRTKIVTVFEGFLYVFHSLSLPAKYNNQNTKNITFYNAKQDMNNYDLYVLANSELNIETLESTDTEKIRKYATDSIIMFKEMMDFAEILDAH